MRSADQMSEHEAAVARHLFDKVMEAEAGNVATDDWRKHILDTWREVAEAVMRPIQSRAELEQELARLRDEKDLVPF